MKPIYPYSLNESILFFPLNILSLLNDVQTLP